MTGELGSLEFFSQGKCDILKHCRGRKHLHICIYSLEQEHIVISNSCQHERVDVDIVEHHRIHGDVNT